MRQPWQTWWYRFQARGCWNLTWFFLGHTYNISIAKLDITMKHIQTRGFWSRPTWVFSPFNMITMANHGLCVVRLVRNRCGKAYNAPFCTIQNVSLYNEPVVLTINWWPHPHPLTVVLSKQCMVSNGLPQKYQQNIFNKRTTQLRGF